MNKIFLFLIIFAVSACSSSNSNEEASAESAPAESEDVKAPQLAFAEKGDANWGWQDGVWLAEIDSGTGYLISEEVYDNIEFVVEFMPDSTINSGLFIRCANQEISAEDCYEFNIWDLNPNQEYRTGGVVMRTSAMEYVETIGKWNTYRIVVDGNNLSAWINDIQVVDFQDDSHVSGYVGLQAAGQGTIRFRNIQVTPTLPGE